MSGTERLLERLSDGKLHSHESLYRDLGVMVHSRVADLRKKGHVIHVRREWSKSQRRNFWFYRLAAPLNAVAVLPGEGHVVPPSATEDTATATALSGARSTGGGPVAESPPRTVSPSPPSPTTPAIHAAAAVLPETSSALSLFDVPNEPAWA